VEETTAMDPGALLHRKQMLCEEISAIDEQLRQIQARDRHVTRRDELVWEDTAGVNPRGAPLRRAVGVSPHLGFDVHSMRAALIEIPPRSQEGAYHRHGEAVKFYLSGSGIERIGDKEYDVEAGDMVFIPANVWHGTQNPTDDPVRIFAVSQALGANVEIPALHKRR
jgi:mannose-6-phosphate isomerase-like protein (cupin superfamily)